MNDPEFANESKDVQQRIKDTYNFVDTLTAGANEILKLSSSTLNRILKLGATIQKFWNDEVWWYGLKRIGGDSSNFW